MAEFYTKQQVDQMLNDLRRSLSADINKREKREQQIIGYVPNGVNWTLKSRKSVDPGHVHVFPEVDFLTYTTFFESLDGFSVSASGVTAGFGGMIMQTSTTINTERGLSSEPSTVAPDWSKDSGFQTFLRLSATTAQLIYFGLGNLSIGDGTEEGYGFKILNGTLYAISTDSNGVSSSSTTVDITGSLDLTAMHTYKAIKHGDSISYYVDGIIKATITTNLPTGSPAEVIFYSIKNTEAANKSLDIAYMTVFFEL